MADPGSPIVIDLGKKASKQLKALKKGAGKLRNEVLNATAEVKNRLGSEADGKELLPIVIVYRRKRKAVKSGLRVPMLF